jgi:hypothetical protein
VRPDLPNDLPIAVAVGDATPLVSAAQRIGAIAQRVIRQRLRGRLIWWTLAVALLMWLTTGELHNTTRGTVSVLAIIAVLSTVFIAAGALADDLDSGALMLDLLASARPIHLAAGTAMGVFAAALPAITVVTLVAIPQVVRAVGAPNAVLLLSAVYLLAFGWVALGTCLGTVIPGKGNAAVLAPFFFGAGSAANQLPLADWPDALAAAARALWNGLPLVAHVQAWRDAILDAHSMPLIPVSVLLLGPVAWIALAAFILSWRSQRLRGDA